MLASIKNLLNKIFKKSPIKEKEEKVSVTDEMHKALNDNFYKNFNNLI